MFNTIRGKVIIYFLLSFIIIIGLYGFITYNMIKNNLETEMQNRLLTAGRIIKETVNPDDLQYLQLKGKIYDTYREKLKKLRDIILVRDIFLIDTNKRVILSTLDESDKFFIQLDAYEIDQALKGNAISTPLYRGAKGEYYKTGYVALDDKGKTTGIIGVEASVEYIKYINQYRNFLVTLGAIGFIFAFVLSFLISSGMTRSIIRLKEKAEQIAKRNFDENIDVKGEEEINVLANTLDSMKKELKTYIENREKMATVGEFSAGIAHEIRNSLNVLSGYAELIKEKAKDEKIKKHADDITRNAMKMSDFLNNFLTYTKDSVPDKQELNVVKLIDESMNELPHEVREIVKIKPKTGVIKAIVDPFLIRKAVYNVIMNAFQAIDNKEKLIEITISQAGEKAEITIKDNGRGIPDNLKDKIFQPFFTARREGTGLGLAISYKIIKELHNGDISIDSRQGQGTTVTIKI